MARTACAAGSAGGGGGSAASAMQHAGSALLAAITVDPSDTASHAAVACGLGAVVFDLHRYDIAAALFARALEAYAAMGYSDRSSGAGTGAGAVGLWGGGQAADLDPEVALHVAESMNNLAVCAAAMGDAPAAVRLYRRCHTLMVGELKPSHPAMAILLHNLHRQLRTPGAALTLRGAESQALGATRPRLVDEPRLWVSYSAGTVGGKASGGKKGGKKGGGKSPRKGSKSPRKKKGGKSPRKK